MSLCHVVIRNHQLRDKELKDAIMAQIGYREHVMAAFDDMIHINILTKIRYNTLNVSDPSEVHRGTKPYATDNKKTQKPPDQSSASELESSSSDDSSDKEHFPEFYDKRHIVKSQHLHKKPSYHHKQIHVLYCDPREAELSKQEVEQLKKSVLYMRLFDTKSNFFYQWYNSASEQKTQDK